MPTYSDQIESLQSKRAAKLTLLDQLHEKAIQEGRAFSPEEQSLFDITSDECSTINAQLAALEKSQSLSVSSARPVIVPNSPNPRDPTGRTIERGATTDKGISFARYAMALAAGRGNLHQSLEYARTAFGKSSPEVVSVIKAAVAAGTTTDPAWAGPLVDYQTMASEFIDLLRPATIIGRIDGFRRVPFNVRIPRQTAGSSVGWVGESKPKPVGKLGFDGITMPFSKIAGIVAITEELARFSSPSAEALVRSDLVETISTFMDVQFIDPTVVANPAANSPASITNGAHAIPSTGATVAAITADIQAAMAYVSQNGLPLTGLAWVMNPRTKIYLSMLRLGTDDGVFAFPEVGASGTLAGFPIVDSASVPLTDPGDGSAATTFIALVMPSEILLADDGGVTLDASREASIAMSDDGTGALVSLWQNNLVGLRAERYIHWMPRRAACATLITGVSY